jgi:hypothetical protein
MSKKVKHRKGNCEKDQNKDVELQKGRENIGELKKKAKEKRKTHKRKNNYRKLPIYSREKKMKDEPGQDKTRERSWHPPPPHPGKPRPYLTFSN